MLTVKESQFVYLEENNMRKNLDIILFVLALALMADIYIDYKEWKYGELAHICYTV